jgi:hypothetical protein
VRPVSTSSGASGNRPHGRYSDDEIDYLLSAGSLGGTQKNRIFAAVAKSVRHQGSGSRVPRSAAVVLASLAAAACFVVWTWRPFDRDSFRSKGGGTATIPSIDVACLRATLGACPRGSVLAFSARDTSRGMFVTATLEPADSGPRVWLLSNEPTSVEVSGAAGLLARGARVPDEQGAGRYVIEVIVTRRPLPREEVALAPSDVVVRARFETTVPP